MSSTVTVAPPFAQLMTACSGPQSVQQMVIGLCTGHFPLAIQVSTLVSLLSLSWGASRAYFVERILDEADPDPAVLMVLMRVFPLMLIIVSNSMLTWIAIGGLIGPLIFPALLINFATTHSLVRTFTANLENNLTVLKASVYALWLPSIIGVHPRTYIVSAVSVLVTKLLTLALALSYAFSGFQQLIHPRPFVLWCEKEWDQEVVGNLTVCTFDTFDPNFTPCFNISIEGEQKLRLCGDNESTLRIGLFLALSLSNVLSLAASLWLNRISDYVQLYRETKKFLWRSVQQRFGVKLAVFVILFNCLETTSATTIFSIDF